MAPTTRRAFKVASTTGVEIPLRHLVAGIPIRVLRELTVNELASKIEATQQYHQLTKRNLATHVATEPLPHCDAGRKRIGEGVLLPLRDASRKRRKPS